MRHARRALHITDNVAEKYWLFVCFSPQSKKRRRATVDFICSSVIAGLWFKGPSARCPTRPSKPFASQ